MHAGETRTQSRVLGALLFVAALAAVLVVALTQLGGG
jgi:hypothetical protein